MSHDTDDIAGRAQKVLDAGKRLRAASCDARCRWLARAAEELRHGTGKTLSSLARSTGLSESMVEWGARTTLNTVDVKALEALASHGAAAGRSPIAMLSVVLAGNLFTASIRAVFVPLLFGAPIIAKAPSSDRLFIQMARSALRESDAELGAAFDVVEFRGGDVDCEEALIRSSEAVAVYGSDATIAELQQRHGDRRWITHGHGISAAYCSRAALGPDELGSTVAALALDVCAYDQRGCLSPQVIYVQEAEECSASAFAERLSRDGLAGLSRALPRGPLPIEVGVAQAQWRGLAEVEGSLIAGEDHAVAVVPETQVRWSPGYRNVTVAPTKDAGSALSAMSHLGPSLKCIAADECGRSDLKERLERNAALSAYTCPLGRMQTPALDAPADGRPVWYGLFTD